MVLSATSRSSSLPDVLNYGFGGLEKSVAFYGTQDAVPGVTPRNQPLGAQVVPGDYKIVLTVDGQAYQQTVHVVKDPRVPVSQFDYAEQLKVTLQMTDGLASSYAAFNALQPLRTVLDERIKALGSNKQAKDALDAANAFSKKLSAIEGGSMAGPGFGLINAGLTQGVYAINMGDGAPPESMRTETAAACAGLEKAFAEWQKLSASDLPALNSALQKYNLAALPEAAFSLPANSCTK